MDPTRILQEAQRTFTNDVEIDGLETQTVVSTLNQETIAQSSSENLSKLSQVIKDQIKVGKKRLVEMNWISSNIELNNFSDLMNPTITCFPKGWDAATLQESFTQHALKRKGTKSVLVGLLPLSFEIPEEFLIPDMDEVILPTLDAHATPHHNKKLTLFPFSERINVWMFERRRRVDERHDLYYHHKKSKMTFRSTKEVLNFILYNAYPDKKQITKKSALEENPLAQGSGKKRRTFSHEKEASSSSILCRKSNSIQIEEGFIELNVFRTKDDFTESKIIIQKEKDFPKSNVVETEDDFIELNVIKTEENFIGFKEDSYKKLLNYEKKVAPDNLDISDSEATESDEDIYTARQLFQHPLGEETKELKRNKREGTYQPSVQGESSQYPFACQALENSGDGKENKTVTNKNVSEEEIGADVIQTPTTWAVIEKKDNVTSSSKPVEENTGKKGDVEDIFGQLGDLQDASIAEQVLSKQFNQEDDAYKDLYFF